MSGRVFVLSAPVKGGKTSGLLLAACALSAKAPLFITLESTRTCVQERLSVFAALVRVVSLSPKSTTPNAIGHFAEQDDIVLIDYLDLLVPNVLDGNVIEELEALAETKGLLILTASSARPARPAVVRPALGDLCQ